MAEFHFRSMGALQNKSDVNIQFLVGGLAYHFAGIFHLAFAVQKLLKNFMIAQWLEIFLQFLGANMTLKCSLLISRPSKGTTLRISASIEA
jgi:hypothetical protein